MKVRITKASGWYYDKVGEIVEVSHIKEQYGRNTYICSDWKYKKNGCFISEENCEVTPGVEFIPGNYYLCNVDFFMKDGEEAFSKGKSYLLKEVNSDGPCFIDNKNEAHYMEDYECIFEELSSAKLEEAS